MARVDPAVPRTTKEKAEFTTQTYGAWEDCSDTVASWSDRRKKYTDQYNGQFNWFDKVWRAATGADKAE